MFQRLQEHLVNAAQSMSQLTCESIEQHTTQTVNTQTNSVSHSTKEQKASVVACTDGETHDVCCDTEAAGNNSPLSQTYSSYLPLCVTTWHIADKELDHVFASVDSSLSADSSLHLITLGIAYPTRRLVYSGPNH